MKNKSDSSAHIPPDSLPRWTPPDVRPFRSALEHLEALIQRIGDLVTAHLARMPEDRRGRDGNRTEYLLETTSFANGQVPKLTNALWAIADAKPPFVGGASVHSATGNPGQADVLSTTSGCGMTASTFIPDSQLGPVDVP